MDKIYWKSSIKNIGDELNADFYEKAMGRNLDLVKPGEAILGIGSILDFDTSRYQRVHVLGSGAGSKNVVVKDRQRYRFWFVRGPMTAELLGLDKSLAITDPALVAPEVYGLSQQRTRIHSATFIPHYFSEQHGGWKEACAQAGIHYTLPTSSLAQICHDIHSSELVVTESLHGAILADACRTPWILARTPQVARFPFKWHDWMASVGMRYQPIELPWLSTLALNRIQLIRNTLKSTLWQFKIGPASWGDKVTFISTDRQIADAGRLLKAIVENEKPNLTSNDLSTVLKSRVMGKLQEFSRYLDDESGSNHS